MVGAGPVLALWQVVPVLCLPGAPLGLVAGALFGETEQSVQKIPGLIFNDFNDLYRHVSNDSPARMTLSKDAQFPIR